MKINNSANESINRIIVESQTISEDVMISSKEIEKYILDNIQNAEVVKTYNGGTQRFLQFSINVFPLNRENDNSNKPKLGLRPFITVNCHNFLNMAYFNQYNKKHTIDTQCDSVYISSGGGKRAHANININFISINFEPLPKFYQDAPHEVNHLFQQYMERDTYPDAMKYMNIANLLQFNTDENVHKVAHLLYITNTTEQDSFIASVYPYTKREFSKHETDIDTILKQTDAYKKIIEANELFEEIKEKKEIFALIIKNNYDFKSWNIFLRRIKSLIERFERKFAMVTKKCKNDFILYETHTFYSGNFQRFYLLK